MRRTISFLIVVLALASLARPAGAQPASMDLRQASGQPLPDSDVGVGVLTVMVVHGDCDRPAKPGTPVSLVALHADGRIDVLVAPVDDSGRATFKGLDASAATSYYAHVLLDGDRLESRIMTLDRMSGMRLLFAGRSRGADGQPVGPPIDDTQGQGAPAIPAGEVWILFRGVATDVGTPVELVQLGTPAVTLATVSAIRAPGEANEGLLFARFSGVTAKPGTLMVGRVLPAAGKPALSRPFMTRADAGVGREMFVTDRVFVTAHVAVERDDEHLRGQVQYVVQNLGGAPLEPPAGGFILPLPPLGTNPALGGEAAGISIDNEKRIVVTRALKPGSTEIRAGFGLEVEGGRVSFELPAPHGIFQGSLVVEHVPGARFTGPPTGGAVKDEAHEGRRYSILRDLEVPEGGALVFAVDGLPRRPLATRVARAVAAAIAVGFVVLGLVLAFVGRGRRARSQRVQAGNPVARRKSLIVERERLYDALVAIERDRARHAGGDLAELERRRGALLARLTVTLRELDDLDAGLAAS